jgi:hypothetical protein
MQTLPSIRLLFLTQELSMAQLRFIVGSRVLEQRVGMSDGTIGSSVIALYMTFPTAPFDSAGENKRHIANSRIPVLPQPVGAATTALLSDRSIACSDAVCGFIKRGCVSIALLISTYV